MRVRLSADKHTWWYWAFIGLFMSQEGIEHPKQLHGKIMEANWTLRNGYFWACNRKLCQETANAMNITCSVPLYHDYFVPLLSLKEWRNGKEELQSAKGEPVTELWTGNLKTSWWAPSMWYCTGCQPQKKGSDFMVYRHLCTASTITFALCLGQKHPVYITHSLFPWNWSKLFSSASSEKEKTKGGDRLKSE